MNTDWITEAACRDEEPELFFPTGNPYGAAYRKQVKTAQAVCRRCPVREKCLQRAVANREEFGIWAGLEEGEPRRLATGARKKRSRSGCGSVSGYETHEASGTKLCAACRRARYDADRKQAEREWAANAERPAGAEYAELAQLGWSHRDIAARFRIQVESVQRAIERYLEAAS